MRARRIGAFASLVRAAAAITQRDPKRLSAALSTVAPDALLKVAARHKCSGFLLRGITTLGVGDPSGGRLTRELKTSCQSMAIRAIAIRPQLESLVRIFASAGLPCVLLKAAARLYAEEDHANWNAFSDLDILIRERDAAAAMAALVGAGYRETTGPRARSHHHLEPLDPPGAGVQVELHLALAPPSAMSLRYDWDALGPYVRTVRGRAGEALCLDSLGTSLHLAIHGSVERRLIDIAMLARLLCDDPSLFERLLCLLRRERMRPIPPQGTVALAAILGGISWDSTGGVRRYAEWMLRREDLPTYLRARAQWADAWFGSGGLVGLARSLAKREVSLGGETADNNDRPALHRVAGRFFTGASAALLAAVSPGLVDIKKFASLGETS